MTQSSDLERENQALRERLSRLSEASLRINESLEFDTVLQEVLDSARVLSSASYGVITLFNDSGAVAAFLASGMTPEEAEGLWAMADGPPFLEHLRSLAVPVRSAHLTATPIPSAWPVSARWRTWAPSCGPPSGTAARVWAPSASRSGSPIPSSAAKTKRRW